MARWNGDRASLATRSFGVREISIPAELSHLRQARQFAAAAAADFGFDEDQCYRIKLAANEAVANAVEHGSSSPQDTVIVRAAEEEGAIALYVIDGGRFRDRPLDAEGLEERGRGLAFMDRLMDEVEVRTGVGGTVIRLLKRLVG
jgi:anti-sigma regulatory factor (Ser/Thr protein kinase)